MFAHIAFFDFSKPAGSKRTGYYREGSSSPGGERVFYVARRGLRMDEHGSAFRLRLSSANDYLEDYGHGALKRITGYYCDDYQDQTMKPIVARLPRSRGFLAGWTMGEGMVASLDVDTVHETAEEAARAAHAMAESAAEKEQEYQREQERKREEEERAAAVRQDELDAIGTDE